MKFTRILISSVLGLATAATALAGNVTLPLNTGMSGVVNVGSQPVSFTQGDFTVTLRPRTGASSTSFYFGPSYAYGSTCDGGNCGASTSEVDIVRTDGGLFSFVSVEQWAFQGSPTAILGLQGFFDSVLQGAESFSLSTSSYTSALQLATSALAGKSLDKLVLLPDFTTNPTNQAGFAGLTLDVAPNATPEPGTLALVLLGLAGLLRRKTR